MSAFMEDWSCAWTTNNHYTHIILAEHQQQQQPVR